MTGTGEGVAATRVTADPRRTEAGAAGCRRYRQDTSSRDFRLLPVL